MTEVATQSFAGNVTTHTPGILRGGMNAIERHPKRKELLAGGADGAPKLFRMDVKAAPSSGGNPNQIREYAALPGRVFDVCFGPEGALAFAASSLDGTGQVRAYQTDSGDEVWKFNVVQGGIFALASSPDATTLAAAGFDGWVRLIDVPSGTLKNKFLPVEVSKKRNKSSGEPLALADLESSLAAEQAPSRLLSLEVEPKSIDISRPTDYVQIILTAKLSDGGTDDATRMAK